MGSSVRHDEATCLLRQSSRFSPVACDWIAGLISVLRQSSRFSRRIANNCFCLHHFDNKHGLIWHHYVFPKYQSFQNLNSRIAVLRKWDLAPGMIKRLVCPGNRDAFWAVLRITACAYTILKKNTNSCGTVMHLLHTSRFKIKVFAV